MLSGSASGVMDGKSSYHFAFDLVLKGSQQLYFAPVGRETKVKIQSKWATPSFDGAFLPDNRTISDAGFTADWKVLHLNRNYPQSWTGARNGIIESAFGVNLLLPTDHYKKSIRTVKYAFILIALTFLIFFFMEILNGRLVHPFQYILVGMALCIFYTLLLSFSEHLNFNIAYTLAAAMTVGMVTFYAKTIFETWQLAALVGGILTILYLFVFTIVQLNDYALLIGSLGLFGVLGIVMYLSRKIDWYNLGKTEKL